MFDIKSVHDTNIMLQKQKEWEKNAFKCDMALVRESGFMPRPVPVHNNNYWKVIAECSRMARIKGKKMSFAVHEGKLVIEIKKPS